VPRSHSPASQHALIAPKKSKKTPGAVRGQPVGKEGVVSPEEAKGTETTLEVVEGMQFDRRGPGMPLVAFPVTRDRLAASAG
jgi:chaperonin GroEL (HSP60 family)